MRCFTCSSSSHCSKKGKFKGNWTRSFKHGCSRSKLFHESPKGCVHMDSRRAPAVLLLIKTVVITFPILSDWGRGGAQQGVRRGVCQADGQQPALPQRVWDPQALDRKEGPQGSLGLHMCVGVSVTR